MRTPTAAAYIAKAREIHAGEGEIEVDDVTLGNAQSRMVSRSEDSTGEVGAYVKAWVWVPREDIQPDFAAGE